MDLIRPPALRSGDTVAVISLSAGVSAMAPHRHAAGRRQVSEAFGLRTVDTPNALRDSDWLHANPEARADDLHWALDNDDVAGIVTTIGGDDSIRTVPYLDTALIAAKPKVFIGYSDTTVQHLVNRRAGLISFYGPGLLTGFAENGGIHPYVQRTVRRALFDPTPIGALDAAEDWTEEMVDWRDPALATRRRRWWPNPGWAWLQGSAPVEGELIGGCADLLEMVKGTSIWPPDHLWNGAIFAFEISEDAPTPATVGYWLRNYAAAGILQRIGALLVSRPEGYSQLNTFRLWDTIQFVLAESGLAELPVIANLDYGHSAPMGVLPLGCRARVDPQARTISVLDAAVS